MYHNVSHHCEMSEPCPNLFQYLHALAKKDQTLRKTRSSLQDHQ